MEEERLAEFVGILLGDGNLGIYQSRADGRIKTQYRIKVTLNSQRDKEYSIYVAKLFETVFGKPPVVWKRRDANAVDLFLFGERHLSYLTSLGMVLSPKWARAIIPERFIGEDYSRFVLRGYMDTDGCICAVNNNGNRYPRIEMKISPSPMQGQLIELLVRNGFRPQVSRLDRGKVRVTLAGLENLERWNQRIGFSNPRNQMVADSFLRRGIAHPYKTLC